MLHLFLVAVNSFNEKFGMGECLSPCFLIHLLHSNPRYRGGYNSAHCQGKYHAMKTYPVCN